MSGLFDMGMPDNEDITRDEAVDLWIENQDHGCSCHLNPPCSFCVDGYGLPLEEFLDAHGFNTDDYKEDATIDAYDRAMKGL